MWAVRGWNDFYDGWLAWILKQPLDTSKSGNWTEGWRMAEETGENAVEALRPEIEKRHIIVTKGK